MTDTDRELARLRERLAKAERLLKPSAAALEDIAAERRRQIEQEGWTPEHDDAHTDGSLAAAAACYAHPLGDKEVEQRSNAPRRGAHFAPRLWPESWSLKWWKPKDRRRDLVRAAALIVAEIERLDRAERGDHLTPEAEADNG